MSNEEYFNKIKDMYDSLKNFQINNNILTFFDDITYKISLYNVNLSKLNPNIFLLKPKDIHRLLFILEILPKKNLNDIEKKFIIQYVQKYLKLEHSKLSNEEVNDNEVNCLGIPIYLADDPTYENSECSQIIHTILQNDIKKLENTSISNNNQKRLVLTNPQFKTESNQNNSLEEFSDYTKTGFTTILLIAITVIATCTYLAIYFSK